MNSVESAYLVWYSVLILYDVPTSNLHLPPVGLARTWEHLKRENYKKVEEGARLPLADDDILGMAVDSGDRVASGALNIHEIGVGGLNKSLELVLSLFFFKSGV